MQMVFDAVVKIKCLFQGHASKPISGAGRWAIQLHLIEVEMTWGASCSLEKLMMHVNLGREPRPTHSLTL